jgi:hypothetical protein
VSYKGKGTSKQQTGSAANEKASLGEEMSKEELAAEVEGDIMAANQYCEDTMVKFTNSVNRSIGNGTLSAGKYEFVIYGNGSKRILKKLAASIDMNPETG